MLLWLVNKGKDFIGSIMNIHLTKGFWVALLLALLFISPGVAAQQPQGPPSPDKKQEQPPPTVPGLADLISLETKMSARLAVLQKQIGTEFDTSTVEKGLSGIDTKLAEYSRTLENLKVSKSYPYDQLLQLRGKISREGEALDRVIKPLTEATKKFAQARKTWLEERKRWTAWQSVMLTDEPLDELKNIFTRAQITIDSALVLIDQQLQPLLVLLQRAGAVKGNIEGLIAEIGGMALALHRDIQPGAAPPMVSFRYFSQLRNQAWYELRGGMRAIAWPESDFLQRQGWLLVLQVLLSIAVIGIIFRYRSQLRASERWQFLAQLPFAAGIFLGVTSLYTLYKAPPLGFLLFSAVIGGISGARLLASLLAIPWQKILIYALAGFSITTQLLIVIGLPHPIFRLYIVLVSLVGLGLCWWGSVQANTPRYTWLYRVGSLFFVVILIAELGGYSSFAEYLIRASLRTLGIVLGAWLLIYITRGGVEGLVYHTPLQGVPLFRSNPADAVRRLAKTTDVLIITLVLAVLLVVWRVYATPGEAIKGILSLGVTVGSLKITLGKLLFAGVVLYGSFLLSWAIRNLLMAGVLAKTKADAGTQHSITALVHYAIIFVGFLLALAALGFQLTQLTIMISALGVGIGFGLQNIVNNFLSGLILLFERPIKMGDMLVIDGQWGLVKEIRVRSTIFETFDRYVLIIPNSELVSNKVLNWTHYGAGINRLTLKVGVSYGSDVRQVTQIITEVCGANPRVVPEPPPQIFFAVYGDSSLDFTIWVHLRTPNDRIPATHELNSAIFEAFQEHGIKIPFPQRDLHLHSVDDSAASRLHPPENQASTSVPGGQSDNKKQ
jgi:potassium efflux system protein